jgi:hypothetical protein
MCNPTKTRVVIHRVNITYKLNHKFHRSSTIGHDIYVGENMYCVVNVVLKLEC